MPTDSNGSISKLLSGTAYWNRILLSRWCQFLACFKQYFVITYLYSTACAHRYLRNPVQMAYRRLANPAPVVLRRWQGELFLVQERKSKEAWRPIRTSSTTTQLNWPSEFPWWNRRYIKFDVFPLPFKNSERKRKEVNDSSILCRWSSKFKKMDLSLLDMIKVYML